MPGRGHGDEEKTEQAGDAGADKNERGQIENRRGRRREHSSPPAMVPGLHSIICGKWARTLLARFATGCLMRGFDLKKC
jgi:hypothetical protein